VQNGPTTLSISRKSAIARFIPVTLFLSNVIGAFVYVIRASMGGWVDPRTGPASVSGEPFIWFLAILPVVVFFFALNLAWMIVIVRRRWRGVGLWLFAACPPGICDTVRITDAWPFELSRPVIQQMIGEK
jgi:hypothetical protein